MKAEHDRNAERTKNQWSWEPYPPERAIHQPDMEQIWKQIKENEAIKENLNRQIEVVNQKAYRTGKTSGRTYPPVGKIAGLTADEAKNQLIESPKQEAQNTGVVCSAGKLLKKQTKANKEARKIVIQTIQRGMAEQTI